MQPSLFRRLLAALPNPLALLGASKAQQPIRRAEDYQLSRLLREIWYQPIQSADQPWTLETIYAARAQQIAGRFKEPVRLAVAMRTDADLYHAYKVRVAPIGALGVTIKAAAKGRGAAVAREAEVLFGQPTPTTGLAMTAATAKTLVGTLANHGVAIGFNRWTTRPDGSRHDLEHKPWPLEFVEYDSLADRLYAVIDPMMAPEDIAAMMGPEPPGPPRARYGAATPWKVPIVHGDGRWTVYKLSELLPWRDDAAMLAAPVIWAAAAYSKRDWSAGSKIHGDAKIMGTLPKDTPIQRAKLDSEGKPTEELELTNEARDFLELLRVFASREQPYGIAPFGADVKVVANPSNMWQVWKELGIAAGRWAHYIYNGHSGAQEPAGDSPGVDIAQVFDVGTTILQGDVAAIEQGFHTGVMVPWCAANFGDSSLAPERLYELPDVDEQQQRDHATINENAFLQAYEMRKALGILTQEWADEYADRLGVSRVQVPEEHLLPAAEAAPASGVRPAA